MIKAVLLPSFYGSLDSPSDPALAWKTDSLPQLAAMLHELLLALSGHASPLFSDASADAFPLVTPAETELLESISRLANVHRALRSHLESIGKHHSSPICRGVATSIRTTHLARFQEFIVQVERDVLLNDAGSVGAYDIVPLASIVSRFEDWKRILYWYWDLACFISPPEAGPSHKSDRDGNHGCSGVQLLRRLRKELQTGFSDIGAATLELTTTAELIWLRQLMPWIAQGVISSIASNDLFIRRTDVDETGASHFRIESDLVPPFVDPETASSILFIGRTNIMLKSRRDLAIARSNNSIYPSSGSTLQTGFLESLAHLPSPLPTARLSTVIATARSSLATEVIQTVLPVNKIMNVLALMRQFTLAGRGDFIDALIQEADRCLSDRHKQISSGGASDSKLNLAGVMMKAGEISAVLDRTWTALAPLIGKETLLDEDLEWAREHFSLSIPTSSSTSFPTETGSEPKEMPNLFHSFLLSTPASLTLRMDSTLDLFLDINQRAAYAAIHSYLVALRRAHNHLCDLWRTTPLRRDHPAPIKTERTRAGPAFEDLRRRRELFVQRMQTLRKFWTRSSAAVAFLAELGAYLSDEVVKCSWSAFSSWAAGRDAGPEKPNKAAIIGEHIDAGYAMQDGLPQDPEVLARNHEVYLATLCEMLLITHAGYSKALRTFLRDIDHMVATFGRLQSVQHNVDLQEAGVYESHARDYGAEESSIQDDLDRAGGAVGKGMLVLIEQLGRASGSLRRRPRLATRWNYEPYVDVSAIDRLLVRLDSRNEQASPHEDGHLS